MKLTNIEKETILNFNEGEEIASLYTYNQKLQNRFDKLAEELPTLVSRKDNGHGAVTYELPKKMLILKIQKPISGAASTAKPTVSTRRCGSRAACCGHLQLTWHRDTPASRSGTEHGTSTAVSHRKTHPIGGARVVPNQLTATPQKTHHEPPCRKVEQDKAMSPCEGP